MDPGTPVVVSGFIDLDKYKIDVVTVGGVEKGDRVILDEHDYKKDEDGKVSRIDYQAVLKVVATGAIMGSGPRPTVYMIGTEDGKIRHWEDRMDRIHLVRVTEKETEKE